MDEILELLKEARVVPEYDLRWAHVDGDLHSMGKFITATGNLDSVMSFVNALTTPNNQHHYWNIRPGLVLYRKLNFVTPYHEFARYSRD